MNITYSIGEVGNIEKGYSVELDNELGEIFSSAKFKVHEVVSKNTIAIEVTQDDARKIVRKDIATPGDFVIIDAKNSIYKFLISPEDIYEIHESKKDSSKEECNQEENIKEKGGAKMTNTNKLKDIFNYGQYEGTDIAITMEGDIAIKREDGSFVRYNLKTNEFENKMDLVITDFNDMIMLMPVTTVAIGDIIMKNNKFYQLINLATATKSPMFINLLDGSKTELPKEKNLFGMEMYTKVVNIMKDGLPFGQATEVKEGETVQVNPMNQMMQMMMMSKLMKKDSDDSSNEFDMKQMILMSMMNGQSNNAQGINPMMLMLMK